MEYNTSNIKFKSVDSYLGKPGDADNGMKESKLNMAVLELLRSNHRLNILNIVRADVFKGNYSKLMEYFTQLEVIFYEWSGLIYEKIKIEIKDDFEKFKQKYKIYTWNLTNGNADLSSTLGYEALSILKQVDLKLMDIKQKLRMGMPTKETYTINERAFKDLEANRNLSKIILTRFDYDKKYKIIFQKWAEEDKNKKLETDKDEDFNSFDDDEDEA
jgi:hypothetical protein